MRSSDPLDRVIRQLEAERYAGGGWRKVPINVNPLDATDTPEQQALRRAQLDAEVNEHRKATEARRKAARQARIDAWKWKRESA